MQGMITHFGKTFNARCISTNISAFGVTRCSKNLARIEEGAVYWQPLGSFYREIGRSGKSYFVKATFFIGTNSTFNKAKT